MRKFFLLSLIIGMIAISGACSKVGTENPNVGKAERQAGAGTTNAGLINFIKTNRLANFKSNTIGNAFDSYKYLTRKDWVARQENNNFTVSFQGWFEPDVLKEADKMGGITGKGLEVMFVVNPDGSFYLFMVSMLESKADGKVYRGKQADETAILTKIYSNEKISL